MDLNTIAFILLGVMITGYALLDGFDLGVGTLTLFVRPKEERDLLISAIDPVWDGNQVWLLATGNVLFAAFPLVFTSVFGGMYIAVILLLTALIARTVAIEFRRMHSSSVWNRYWDRVFGIGCLGVAVLLGTALGNILYGLPIGAEFSWKGTAFEFLNAYSLLIGLLAAALFVMHGALYLNVKTTGGLSVWLTRVALRSYWVFLLLYSLAALAGLFVSPFLFSKVDTPFFRWLTASLVLALILVPINIRAGRKKTAFAASSATVGLMVLETAHSLYPVLVPSRLGMDLSLTIYNAASTPSNLLGMVAVATVGLPIMLAYTFCIYRIFRDPVNYLRKESGSAEGQDSTVTSTTQELDMKRESPPAPGQL